MTPALLNGGGILFTLRGISIQVSTLLEYRRTGPGLHPHFAHLTAAMAVFSSPVARPTSSGEVVLA